MTDRELLQQALDTLRHLCLHTRAVKGYDGEQIQTAIDALKARLSQPEPEPVAWGIANTRPTEKQPLMMVMLDKPEPSHLVIPLYTAPPRRELCQCDDIHNDCTYKKNCRVPQIDAAFKRIEWQGLTDAEIELFCGQSDHSTWNAIELAQSRLKEKNL